MSSTQSFPKLLLPCFDNEPSGEPGGSGNEPNKVTFTAEQQEHINGLLKKQKEEHRQKAGELATELETLQKNFKGTQEERDALAKRIEKLKGESMTELERTQNAHKQALADLQSQVEELTKNGDRWRGLYSSSQINTALLDSAVKAKAINPNLVVNLLRSDSEIDPVLDADGNETGEYKVIVKLGKAKDGTPLRLSPSEALKAMVENTTEYGSLFASSTKSGTGTHPSGAAGDSGSALDASELARTDPEAYRKLYREQLLKGK